MKPSHDLIRKPFEAIVKNNNHEIKKVKLKIEVGAEEEKEKKVCSILLPSLTEVVNTSMLLQWTVGLPDENSHLV